MYKICSKCKEEKTCILFSRRALSKDGFEARCKNCIKDYQRVNHSRIAEVQNIRYKANKDKCAEYNKAYYDANKENRAEYGEANKDKMVAVKRAWQKANPSKVNAITAKRRATKLNATPNWLTSEQYKQIESFYFEAQSLSLSTGVKHHVDHILPLQGVTVCGLHVPWNLQVLTAVENISKSNKLQEDIL